MTFKQEYLRQRLNEIITNVQNPYDSDETMLHNLANNFGMILPDFSPPYTIQLSSRQTDFFRSVAEFKTSEEGWPNTKDLLYGYLSEFAFHLALTYKVRRHKWASIYFGLAQEASLDFTVWNKGKQRTIGIRSSQHLNFLRYFKKPIVFYPADRLENAKTKIASFIVPASIFEKDNGITEVAFWGAITRQKLVRVMERLKTSVHERGNYLGETKDIPLSEFSPTLLEHLLESFDIR